MKKYKIIQIPIYMKTRKYGDSKINLTEIISALCYLIKIFLNNFFKKNILNYLNKKFI
jgi:hypothetical protein